MSASRIGKRCAWCGGTVALAGVCGLRAEGRYEYVILWLCMAVAFVALAEIGLARNPPPRNSARTFSKRDLLRSVTAYLVFMAVLASLQQTQILSSKPGGLVVPAVLLPAVAWITFKRYSAWCGFADSAISANETEGEQRKKGLPRSLGRLER